jgi:hypothetical protein
VKEPTVVKEPMVTETSNNISLSKPEGLLSEVKKRKSKKKN